MYAMCGEGKRKGQKKREQMPFFKGGGEAQSTPAQPEGDAPLLYFLRGMQSPMIAYPRRKKEVRFLLD